MTGHRLKNKRLSENNRRSDRNRPARLLLLLAAIALLVPAAPVHPLSPSTRVTDGYNRHNLSIEGPGEAGVTRATTESQVCIFCHAPHHTAIVQPLWSRDLPDETYTPYASSTLRATTLPDQPNDASLRCLSCHDGTIALGMLSLEGGAVRNIDDLPSLAGREGSHLSTDLYNDHPISFPYASSLSFGSELISSPSGVELVLGEVECTTCHDPHQDLYPPEDEPTESGKFLVLDNNQNSGLCIACHDVTGWPSSAHLLPGDPCGNCHMPHDADQPERLLQGSTSQESCLLNCHDGSGSEADIASMITYGGVHLAGLGLVDGKHDQNENPMDFDPLASEEENRAHVECADCHNPHQMQDESEPLAAPPLTNGRIDQVVIERLGTGTVTTASYEYEICFKCHSENSFTPVAVPRQISEPDLSLRFDSDNDSFHPVTAVSATSSSSLRPDMMDVTLLQAIRSLASGRVYCTDCHNSDSGPTAKGFVATEPNGPHGTNYPHNLIANYEQDSPTLSFQVDHYTLCFRCHDPAILLSGGTFHTEHVMTLETPCSVCHDPHGVPPNPLVTNEAVSLINFDTRFVDKETAVHDASARSCDVSCHGTNPKLY